MCMISFPALPKYLYEVRKLANLSINYWEIMKQKQFFLSDRSLLLGGFCEAGGIFRRFRLRMQPVDFGKKPKTVTQAQGCLQEEEKTSAVIKQLWAFTIYLAPSSINYPVFLSSHADQWLVQNF